MVIIDNSTLKSGKISTALNLPIKIQRLVIGNADMDDLVMCFAAGQMCFAQ